MIFNTVSGVFLLYIVSYLHHISFCLILLRSIVNLGKYLPSSSIGLHALNETALLVFHLHTCLLNLPGEDTNIIFIENKSHSPRSSPSEDFANVQTR